MNIQKISISLPRKQYEFVENYQMSHHYKTRSEVIQKALYLLQQAQLEACYREASKELDNAFDAAISDGLEEDEAW